MSKHMPAIPLQQLSDALTDIVVQAAPSVVSIHSARSHSSGFVWRPGLIVTADDALDDEGAITIHLAGGDRVAARYSLAVRRRLCQSGDECYRFRLAKIS